MTERIMGVLHLKRGQRPQRASEKTLAETEVARTVTELAPVETLRRCSPEQLVDQVKRIEATSVRCFERIFAALGDEGRLWWINRRAERRNPNSMIGQEMLGEMVGGFADAPPQTVLDPDEWLRLARETKFIPSGRKIHAKAARAIVAASVGLRADEGALRKLPPDPIAFRHAAKPRPAK